MNEALKSRSCWPLYKGHHNDAIRPFPDRAVTEGDFIMSRMTFTHKMILSAVAITAAAAMALPASAQCYRDSNADGAIVGAIAGAAIGNAASGRHNRGSGTAAGAVIGAVAGAAIDDSNDNCRYDNGYRSSDRRYYSEPRGYYRSQVYVEPRGYYYRDRHDRYDRRYDRRSDRRHDRRHGRW